MNPVIMGLIGILSCQVSVSRRLTFLTAGKKSPRSDALAYERPMKSDYKFELDRERVRPIVSRTCFTF